MKIKKGLGTGFNSLPLTGEINKMNMEFKLKSVVLENNQFYYYKDDDEDKDFRNLLVGDYCEVSGFSNSENNGRFKILGVFENRVVLDNKNAISEEASATLTYNKDVVYLYVKVVD